MTRFTKGLIAGGMLGALGATMAVGDKKTKKSLMRNSKKIASETEHLIDGMKDRIW